MNKIVVYCGSSAGNDNIYREQATLLGKALAERNIKLVYGGAQVGLMGAVANGVLDHGGYVIGVMPKLLMKKEIVHPNLSELILEEGMQPRKTKMAELCDGVIALPGGFGTLDELFEMLTWGQLNLHQKPIAILNVKGYYDSLLAFIENMVKEGILKPEYRQMLMVGTDIDLLLNQMSEYEAPVLAKWI